MKTIGYFLLVLITVLNCKPKELTPDEILDLKVYQTFPIKIETRSTKTQVIPPSVGLGVWSAFFAHKNKMWPP